MSAEKVRGSAQNRDKFLENQRLFSASISEEKPAGKENYLPKTAGEKVRRFALKQNFISGNQRLLSARISGKKSTEKSPPADVRRKGSQIIAELAITPIYNLSN